MSSPRKELPDTLAEPDGTVLTRGVRPFTVTYRGESITVDLPGYYPVGEGESVHVGADLAVTDRALHAIKRKLGEIASDEGAPSRPAAAE